MREIYAIAYTYLIIKFILTIKFNFKKWLGTDILISSIIIAKAVLIFGGC